MNYELKTVQPGSVFINALRIYPVIGFIVAVLTYFVFGGAGSTFGQKLIAVIVSTVIYTLVISGVLSLIAFLYNFWAQRYAGIKVHFEQTEE